MHWENGYFPFTRQTIIACTVVDEGIKKSACYLQKTLGLSTKKPVVVGQGTRIPPKSIILQKSTDGELGKEAYRLLVSPDGITIEAAGEAGMFYGVQTLLQLLPMDVYGQQAKHRTQPSESPACKSSIGLPIRGEG